MRSCAAADTVSPGAKAGSVTDETISGILGGNFMRVARQAWNPTGATAGPSSDHGAAGERAPWVLDDVPGTRSLR
jgi:hypothetical protein